MEKLIEMMERIQRFLRIGFYLAKNTGQYDKFGRTTIHPSWSVDAHPNAKRISCPILDVRPPIGSTAAIISVDGVPAHPANMGVMYDSKFKLTDQTVWVRADLEKAPGVLDIGANQGIRIKVGTKPEVLNQPAPQKVVLANDTVDVVAQTLQTQEHLLTVVTAVNTFIVAKSALDKTYESVRLNVPLEPAAKLAHVSGTIANEAAITSALAPVGTQLPVSIAALKTIAE